MSGAASGAGVGAGVGVGTGVGSGVGAAVGEGEVTAACSAVDVDDVEGAPPHAAIAPASRLTLIGRARDRAGMTETSAGRWAGLWRGARALCIPSGICARRRQDGMTLSCLDTPWMDR